MLTRFAVFFALSALACANDASKADDAIREAMTAVESEPELLAETDSASAPSGNDD